jgi:hypothetical protein
MVLAAEMERTKGRPDRACERIRGYGVTGLSFVSGHILAFHRVTQSSIGPAYTAIWHRSPDGIWMAMVDVDPERASGRYFGSAFQRVLVDRIELEWKGRKRLHLRAPAARLQWAIRLASDPATRLLSWVTRALPEGLREQEWALGILGWAAGWTVGTESSSLTGRTPNGQRFAAVPRTVWRVEASAAVAGGEDLGPLGPHPAQARIGEIRIPRGDIFVFGDMRFRDE